MEPLTILSQTEVNRRAHELYEKIWPEVETEDNIGKLIFIDVETGQYEIESKNKTRSSPLNLQPKNPLVPLFALRIGYKEAFSFCGAMERIIR